jgi:hypothetical protein
MKFFKIRDNNRTVTRLISITILSSYCEVRVVLKESLCLSCCVFSCFWGGDNKNFTNIFFHSLRIVWNHWKRSDNNTCQIIQYHFESILNYQQL